MKTNNLLVCALCPTLIYADSSLRLYHRIWTPSSPPPLFTLRGNLQVSQESGINLVASGSTGELLFDQSEGSLYQLALEREGDLSESDWGLSSVKACHLALMESDIINIHMSASDKAYAADYFVRPVPHDGSCPETAPNHKAKVTFANTTVTLRNPIRPPLPQLRAPPPLSPKGEPIKPEPEQSFLQKYWMYIALGLITLVLTGGAAPPEEEQASQTQVRPSGGR